MKIKTSELIGPALDWAVAKCEGFDTRNNCMVEYMNEQDSDDVLEFVCMADDEDHAKEQLADAYPESSFVSAFWPQFSPSTDWSQGGPIIERKGVSLKKGHSGWWIAKMLDVNDDEHFVTVAHTPLIAAMRCYVASKIGDEVNIPEELL